MDAAIPQVGFSAVSRNTSPRSSAPNTRGSSGTGPGHAASQAASPAGRTSPATLDMAAAAPARPVAPGRPSRPAAGPPGGAAPRPGGATPAVRRPWLPNSWPAAQATAAPGSAADTAVEEPCADHRGPSTPLANSQLSPHDRLSGHPQAQRSWSLVARRTSSVQPIQVRHCGTSLPYIHVLLI
jgi:hypothetical protein